MVPELIDSRNDVKTGLHGAHRRIDPQLEMLARWMDSVFEIPGLGVRFGLDGLIGMIPGFGDALTSLISLYILSAAKRYGVPRVTLARMALNIGIDFVAGSLPLVGDVFDVYWKANLKNVELLRRHVLATPAEGRRVRAGDWLFIAALCALLVALLVGSMVITWLFVMWLAEFVVRLRR